MASSELEWEDLRRRARRAYELGRVRAAVPLAVTAALPVLGALALDGRKPVTTGVLGGGLVLLCLGLGWWGRQRDRAVVPGLVAGLFPLLVPYVVRSAGHVCAGGGCRAFCLAACVVGGLAAGGLILREALRLDEGRTGFVLAAGAVATLCGALTCILYGLSGVLGLAAGLALVSAPVLVLSRA